MTEDKCLVCGAIDWEKLNTYKHRWYSCNECNSVFARRKDRYLLSSAVTRIPIKLLNRLCGGKLRFLEADFLKDERLVQDESIGWSMYADMLRADSGLDPWNAGVDPQLAMLKELGIEYRGKRILSLSGGPGIFAKKLSEFSDVVITEYSADVVKEMKERLGLNAVRYDFNSERLEDVVSGKFDLVFAEGIVNWCDDQKRFIQSLTKVLNERAVVFITNNTFSLGYMLTWQFMDHMATTFVQNEAFLSLFYQAGRFSLIGKYQNKYNSYWYRVRTGGWKNKIQYLFRTPFWILYGAIALLPWKNLNRKWWSNNNISVLRLG